MSYRKALDVLRNYEPKALIAGDYRDKDGACCAIGVLVPATGEAIANIKTLMHERPKVAQAIEALGMTPEEAIALQDVNDGYGEISEVDESGDVDGDYSDEARYQAVIAYMASHVAAEPPQ